MTQNKQAQSSPDLGRLRHRTREVYYLRDDGVANFSLRREFESISKSHNALVDELAAMLGGTSATGVGISTYRSARGGTGGSEGGETAADVRVAIYDGDEAGYLQQKIAAGDGIAIEPTFGPVGQMLIVRLDMQLRQYSFSFQGREVSVYHPFSNYLYDFTIDKPLPDGALGPLTYETYKKYPNHLWLRFADSEYGVITLTGRLGAVQVG